MDMHVEWLLQAKETGAYYTIITPEFGGGGTMETEILIRIPIIYLTNVIHNREIARKKIGHRQRILGGHKLKKLTKEQAEEWLLDCKGRKQ